MTTAIIVARGGSRRLPRKNVLPFCGHPVIAWSIVQAKTAKLVDRVIMCTDDDEIERISVDYGAEVIREPRHPEENAHRAFRWAIDKCDVDIALEDEILSIMPTSPIRRPGDFDACITARRLIGAPVMSPCFVQREVVLSKIIGEHQARIALIDKGSEYVTPSMGYGAFNATYYAKTYINQWGDDQSIEEFESSLADGPTEGWWYEVPAWTGYEVDTVEEFEFCEVVMEHYVLKGKKMEEVYG